MEHMSRRSRLPLLESGDLPRQALGHSLRLAATRNLLMGILSNAGLESDASRSLQSDAALEKFLSLLATKGLASLSDAHAVVDCFRRDQTQRRAQRAPPRGAAKRV